MNPFWSLETGDENILEILHEIDSEQYWDGQKVTASNAFRQALADARGPMNVLINSPGGDTFAGADMYTALREYSASRGRVTCYVTGLAASAASLVAMAGDEVVISEVGMMMIHDPWTLAMGNAAELRELADTLDTVRDAVAAAYVARTGKSAQEIRGMMARERYMTAQEAIADGFADRVGVCPFARARPVASALRADAREETLERMKQAARDMKARILDGEDGRQARFRARTAMQLKARCL